MPERHAAQPEEESIDLSGFQSAPDDQGMSLDDLSSAFAELLGRGDEPYGESPRAAESGAAQASSGDSENDVDVTPRGILEAMLFVGNPDGSALSATRVASLMRGVRAAEIDGLVAELNEHYAANRCPYHIASDGAGYRMTLRPEHADVPETLRGPARERRLNLSSIETLSIVAYRGPVTAEAVTQLRGKPSTTVLAQLVRRGLVRLERPAPGQPASYSVTARFLEIAGLESLEDLPRAQDLDAK